MAYWDDDRQLWIDDTNPNVTYDPNEGVWRNLVDGTYMDPFTNEWKLMPGGGATQQSGIPATTNQTLYVQPGMELEMLDRELATRRSIAGETAGVQREQIQSGERVSANEIASRERIAAEDREVALEELALRERLAGLDRDTQMQMQEIDNTFREMMAEKERQLQLDLLERRITADQYMQEKEIAQRESEFARNLALSQLQSDRDYEIQQAQLRLQEIGEVRAERELEARLAANPQDFVAYELFKRSRDQAIPANAMAQAQGFQEGNEGLTPGGFPAPPPAYDDATLQSIASGLFGGNQQQLYNPNLAGTGIFGAQIQGPQSISRAEGNSMSEAQMGILSSFLRAGVEATPGGPRIALDPAEYFSQVQDSWIPTLADASAVTNYR